MNDVHILVHDIGTTGDKACLFNENAELISKEYERYDTYYPQPGWVEQRPEDWWQAACSNTRKVLADAEVSPEEVGCVTWSGQMMGCIPVDDGGSLLQDQVILWPDTRATEEAEHILNQLGGWETFYEITGTGQSVARYPVAKILWLKKNLPKLYNKTDKFLNAKDYFSLVLTGKKRSDYTDAFHSGIFDLKKEKWSEDIIEAANISKEKLPDLCESAEIVGYTREKPAKEMGLKEGIPVVAGSGDVPAAAAGAGVLEEGDSYISVGSACWTGSFSDKPILDTESRISSHRHVVPGKYTPHNYTYGGGISRDWVKDTMFSLEEKAAEDVGMSVHDIIDHRAQKIPPGSDGILFLPYMRGGGAPHYNDNIKGTFLGLTLSHKKDHLARAVLEGVALNTRVIQENFEGLGVNIEDVRIIGGGALSDLWRQIFADVTGKNVICSELIHESNSLGAAVVGGVGIDLFDGFDSAKDYISAKEVHEPQGNAHEKYNEIYSVFKNAYKEVEPLYQDLASVF